MLPRDLYLRRRWGPNVLRVTRVQKSRLAITAGLLAVVALLVWLVGSEPAGWLAGQAGNSNGGGRQSASSRPRASAARSDRRGPSIPRFSVEEQRPPRFKPVAFLARQAQRHSWGYRRTAADFFRQETRDEVWANQMEGILRARFDEKKLRELNIPSLRVDQLECRTSTCRLEVSWDQRDQVTTAKLSERVEIDPLSLVTTSTGPLAAVEFRENPVPGEVVIPRAWAVRRREDGRLAVRDALLFGEKDIDPASYHAWVEWVADNMRAAPDLVR
jgi:hypothetical protein